MKTTIEIPAELAERLRVVAAARGEDMNRFAVAVLTHAAESNEASGASADEAEETRAALEEAFADVEAGRTISLDDYRAQFEAERAERHQKRSMPAR
jgi:hypothetical protein